MNVRERVASPADDAEESGHPEDRTNSNQTMKIARVVDVPLNDQRAVLTICSRIQGAAGCDGVTLGLPHLVGGEGAMGAIPLPLEPVEQEALERSASILRGAIEALKLT
jgi:L-lactate dehydrogenase